ncbi:unnamed protein product [Dicrocoelium dendriticum]|nr:unnamed protein product [Dicrocoelium dendriticum]
MKTILKALQCSALTVHRNLAIHSLSTRATHQPTGATVGRPSWPAFLTVVLVSLVICGSWLTRHEPGPSEPQRPQKLYSYKGHLNVSGAFFVHLVTTMDLLIRLTPDHADADLFVATAADHNRLISRLPPHHRSKCSHTNPLYRFQLEWDELIDLASPEDMHKLFPYQSSTIGVDELVVTREHTVQAARPILIMVLPYFTTHYECDFLLEILTYRPPEPGYEELQQSANKDCLTFEELSIRYATLPDDIDSFEATSKVDTSQPSDPISPSFLQRIARKAYSLQPLLATLLDVFFDALM